MNREEERKKERSRHVDKIKLGNMVTNNQIQLGPIIAAHYNSARRAIEVWIERRDQYIAYYIAAVTAVAGLYLKEPTASLAFLGVIPASSLMFLLAYYSADIHIAHLSSWLQDEYSDILDNYAELYGVFSLRDTHWDNSDTLREYWKKGAGSRYWFLGAIVALSNAAVSLEIGRTDFKNHWPTSIFALLAIIPTAIVLFSSYRSRKAMAKS